MWQPSFCNKFCIIHECEIKCEHKCSALHIHLHELWFICRDILAIIIVEHLFLCFPKISLYCTSNRWKGRLLKYRKPALKDMFFHCLCMCQVQYIFAFHWYKNKSFKNKGLQGLTQWSKFLVISVVLLMGQKEREINFLNRSLSQTDLGVSQKKEIEDWLWGLLYTGTALPFSKKNSWKYIAKSSSHRKVLSRDKIHSHIYV